MKLEEEVELDQKKDTQEEDLTQEIDTEIVQAIKKCLGAKAKRLSLSVKEIKICFKELMNKRNQK